MERASGTRTSEKQTESLIGGLRMASKFNVWIRIEQVYTDGSTETTLEDLAAQADDVDEALNLKDELIEHAGWVAL